MQNKHLFMLLCVGCLGVAIAALFALPAEATAQNNEQIPRYGNLKRAITNVRSGPGTQYPILWVFKRKSWPVEITARYQSWYRIRDMEGEEGWVYASMVSNSRTVVVQNPAGETTTMYRKKDGSKSMLRFQNGVVLNLKSCDFVMCKTTYRNYKGWVAKQHLAMAGTSHSNAQP